MSKQELDKLMYIKNNDIIRPLYKLLLLIYLNYNRNEILKDILDGNYSVLLKETLIRNYIDIRIQTGQTAQTHPSGREDSKTHSRIPRKTQE